MARALLLIAAAAGAAAGATPEPPALAMHVAADDECAADGACAMSALQRQAARAKAGQAPGVAMLGCGGPWCDVVNRFNALFDTNDPEKMQQALDAYSEWPRNEAGIAVAVTKDHYYEMYHKNVKAKLAEYLPQGMFGWSFSEGYTVFQSPAESNGNEVVLLREGTITLAMGWFRRNVFWNAVIKPMPDGHTFPNSHVEEFDDCDKCKAELVYTMRKGGLDGVGDEWAITGLAVVKLA